MTPSIQQKQWLKDYLRAVLEYRETYEEVYDHVLLALEKSPEDQFFERSVNTIIEADFGGGNGLMRLEENCKSVAIKDAGKQYRSYFRKWLKFPFVLYTIAFSLATYYVAGHINMMPVIGAFAILLMLPIYLLPIRGFKTGYKLGDTKTSLKDSIFRTLAYTPLFNVYRLEVLLFIVHKILQYILRRELHFSFLNNSAPVFLTIALTILTIHNLSFYKLYKDEFKASITQ